MHCELAVPDGLPPQIDRRWRDFDELLVTGTQFSWLDAVVNAEKLTTGSAAERLQTLMACFRWSVPPHSGPLLSRHHLREAVIRRLLSQELPYGEIEFLELAERLGERFHDGVLETEAIVPAIRRYIQTHRLSEAERGRLRDALQQGLRSRWNKKLAKELTKEFGAVLVSEPRALLKPSEVWAAAALKDLAQMTVEKQRSWNALLAHCQTASAGTPTAKWLKSARELVSAVGMEEFVQRLVAWLPLVDQRPPADASNTANVANQFTIIEPHQELLKGLAWCVSLLESRDLARALTTLAQSAYKKIPGVGPRAVKVGNACIYALGAMPGMDGVAQLALLKVKVKFGTAQKLIEKALTQAAERLGMPRDEIEELAVPAYGLEEVGVRRETLGEFTCELLVDADGSTELRWLKADGKSQKSVPAHVKKDFADDLKELKAAAKDIEKMLPAQKERIDNLFLAQKSWPLATWRERYLDHPLVGILARRLIWRFVLEEQREVGSGMWLDDRLVNVSGQPLDLSGAARVELWHPIGRSADEIASWREFLERHEIRQPFKQAHREIYVLTPAEERTHVYSNRYAAHVLKQHQFNALCSARGWKNKLRLMVDDTYPPATRYLPQWGLRAEFWIEGAGDNYGVDTNETGTYLYLTTDQVRFYALEAAQRLAHAAGGGYGRPWGATGEEEPLPLSEVPPLVFSEIMRDVDLFVGVASVGNDPNWNDGGPTGRYVDYWHGYSFGELTETAKTRRQVLERLVPRLKIASRCSLEERFLVVRGDLRTYKIHLGSGNILMSPNDQYLCIVPKQTTAASAGDKVFLPFEGDGVLSVILSKALLLSEDTKIKDPTITAQIGRP